MDDYPGGSTPIVKCKHPHFKSSEKGVQFNPKPRTVIMEKRGVLLKKAKNLGKGGFLGSTHLIRKNISLVAGKRWG